MLLYDVGNDRQVSVHGVQGLAGGFVVGSLGGLGDLGSWRGCVRSLFLRLVGDFGEPAHVGEQDRDFTTRATEGESLPPQQFLRHIW